MRQNSETRQGTAGISIKGWRYAPDTTTSASEFLLFLGGVFFQTVGWVSDDRMDAIGSTAFQPVQTVGLNEFIRPLLTRLSTLFLLRNALRRIVGFTSRIGRTILSEHLSEEGRSVFRMMVENLSHVIGKVAGKDFKRTRINFQSRCYRFDNTLRGFRFSSLQAGKIAFCDLEGLGQVRQRAACCLTLFAEMLPERRAIFRAGCNSLSAPLTHPLQLRKVY